MSKIKRFFRILTFCTEKLYKIKLTDRREHAGSEANVVALEANRPWGYIKMQVTLQKNK